MLSLFHEFDRMKTHSHQLQLQIGNEKVHLSEAGLAQELTQKDLSAVRQEIRRLMSEEMIMQSRNCEDEEKMRENEQLIQHMSAQIRGEKKQILTADQRFHQDVQNFSTDLCEKTGASVWNLSGKLSERMDKVRDLYEKLTKEKHVTC